MPNRYKSKDKQTHVTYCFLLKRALFTSSTVGGHLRCPGVVFPFLVHKQLVRYHYDTELYGLGYMSCFHSGVLLRGFGDAFQFPCIKIEVLQWQV